eukprot:13234390-Ditylum_brightwellii.AAC.1
MSTLGKVIVEKGCIVKRKEPEIRSDLIWPMKNGANQHCVAPYGDGFNGLFYHPMMVVIIGATEMLKLRFQVAV